MPVGHDQHRTIAAELKRGSGRIVTSGQCRDRSRRTLSTSKKDRLTTLQEAERRRSRPFYKILDMATLVSHRASRNQGDTSIRRHHKIAERMSQLQEMHSSGQRPGAERAVGQAYILPGEKIQSTSQFAASMSRM